MSLFNVYSQYSITPVRASGAYVYDATNRSYLDFYGGHAVISIGHSHPEYVRRISEQLKHIGFYSNAVTNPLQDAFAEKLIAMSGLEDYRLFLCNSGAEANENALKLASFSTGRDKILALKGSFHGRTSAAVAATDNPAIIAPVNSHHKVTFLTPEAIEMAKTEIATETYAALIVECIQGVGGLDEFSTGFYKELAAACKASGTFFIADEVQSGYGRTGDFFAFQKHQLQPDIISMAKGMGNGFPIGGILIHPKVEAKQGMLGTTFGGNHLACVAGLAVLDVIKEENLMENASRMCDLMLEEARHIPQIKAVKGRGLMLGFEFEHNIADIRKTLLFEHAVFTGNAKNPNVLRLLPPLCINEQHAYEFFKALKATLRLNK